MEWTRGRTIGRGSTATVSLATARGSGEVFAVKSAELSKSEPLQREQRILSSLNSPRIISYRGFDASATTFDLLMELAPGGSLADEIRRRGGSLGDAAVRAAAREILLGLSYLHSEGVVHCDVKARNVLVTGEGLKIADFGCARRHVEGYCDRERGFCGTPAYVAPEVARGEPQCFAADIWAFGCTVIEMFTGRVSWIDVSDPVSAFYRVGYSGREVEIPGIVSEEGRDFLEKCLRREASERWSARELLEHPFAVGVFGSDFEKLDSPKSVLESSDPGLESGSESPRERVKRLCGGIMDDWASEDGWVTVRGYWAQEGPISLDCGLGNEWSFDNDPISNKLAEMIRISFGDDLACPTKLISDLRNCKHRKRCCNIVRDWKSGLLLLLMMPAKCTKGHVWYLYGPSFFEFNELLFLFIVLLFFFFFFFRPRKSWIWKVIKLSSLKESNTILHNLFF